MASHRSLRRTPQPGQGWPTRVTVLSAAAGAVAALAPAAPAGADPADRPSPSAATVNSRIDRLYEQAESATEKFNATSERASTLREQVEHAQDRAARGQSRVNRMRSALSALASAQYRSGGIDPAVALMLTEDPDGYLEKAATLDRIGSRQTVKLRELQGAQRGLRQQREEAAEKLAGLEQTRALLKRQKKGVQKKLGAARRLLDQLTPEQREERDRASRGAHRKKGGPDVGGDSPSSARAGSAVEAAKSVVGRPYAWGAAGPSSFDCSGLTQWAYARAGTSIPRTSQAQRSAGQQVPMSQARPGDLVTYRDDASHVGMYVGNGQVIHAPHPGAQVRYDPVDMMPVSAVTRP